MSEPHENHLQAARQVLSYLKITIGQGLLFIRNGNLSVEVCTDADYASSVVEGKSTSGYCTFLCDSLITWHGKKQKVVTRSSSEAEVRAMANGICEVIWVKRILEGLKSLPREGIQLYCDNKFVTAIAQNLFQHDITEHVETDRHYIKENIEEGIIIPLFVGSSE